MSTADGEREASLDGMLADWPAPERDDTAWEDLESKLGDRIAGLSVGAGDDSWFEAPFPAEPHEAGYAQPHAAAGDVSMSGSQPEKPKKKSFKEIAQRVSVVPSLATSAEPVSASGPQSKPSAGDGNGQSSRISRPSFVSRPPEARDSDSGLLDLQAVRQSATSIPDAGSMPGTSGIFDDDDKPVPVPASVAKPKAKASVLPIVGGGFVALAAIAAAAMLFVKQAPSAGSMSVAEEPAAAPMATAAADKAGNMPAPPAEQTPEALAVASAAPGSAGEPATEGAGAARSKTGDDDVKAPGKAAPKSDDDGEGKKTAPSDPKDLEGAMAGAVGAAKDDSDKKDKAAGPTVDPSSIPETPSQGAIQGALGSVMGAAKSCVAGMDAPSRANITFASNGSATRVTVSGPASGQAAGSCIQAALKSARVGPFKRSSFTVGVTIRP